ncbi:MAG TPA: hypothetical protein VH637_23760 [Streptosporangiaceae bacterium]|jgi:hypothetical protein
MTARAYTGEFRAAVRLTGVTPEQVAGVLGSCLDGEDTYLTGSLSAGLGNAGSDIDLHVFVAGPAKGVVPMLFFAGRTRLDLVHYQAGAPGRVLAAAGQDGAGDDVPLLGGRCALGVPPGMTDLKRLSRWATSVPLYDGSPPLFGPAELARISAVLVRSALDLTVRAAAMALVLQAAGSALAPLAWSRAAEAAVEVAVRAAGQIFIGEKWLPAKARHAGLPAAVLARARAVESAAGYDEFVSGLGVPAGDPGSLVTLHRADAPEFTFVDRTYRLAGTRLLDAPGPAAGSLAAALAGGGAAGLGEAISAGSVTLSADPGQIDRRLK